MTTFMNWKTFTFGHEVDRKSLTDSLIKIEAYKEAALNLVLPPVWSEQLDRLNRVRAIRGTTALEGNPLSEAEVSQQMKQLDNQAAGDSPDKMTKEQLQIRNAGMAQAWVRRRFIPGSPPLTAEDILKMHRMITQGSDTANNEPGRWRTHPVQVGSKDLGGVHVGAPYADVPRLMNECVEAINSLRGREHAVIRALVAHFFIVTIHPFGDGNGRVSRLVEAGLLFREGYNVHGFYGLSNYFYQNEKRYKTLLQACRSRHPFDLTPFVLFGVEGFAHELKGINNFIKTKLNRLVYRDAMVRALDERVGSRRRLLNRREYSLLDFLLRETEPIDPFSEKPSRTINLSDFRGSPYVQGAYDDVTSRTFVRELVRLSNMGFITFKRNEAAKDWLVEIDFRAVGKY